MIVNKRIWKIKLNPTPKYLEYGDLHFNMDNTYTMTSDFKLDKTFNLEEFYKKILIFPINNVDFLIKKNYKILDLKCIPLGRVIACRWYSFKKGFTKLPFMENKNNNVFKDHILFIMSVGDKNVSIKFWSNGVVHITGSKNKEHAFIIYKYICVYLCHSLNEIEYLNQEKTVWWYDKIIEYPNIIQDSFEISMANTKIYLVNETNKYELKKIFIPLIIDINSVKDVPKCIQSIHVHYDPLMLSGLTIEVFINDVKDEKSKKITITIWTGVAICSANSKKSLECINFIIDYLNKHKKDIYKYNDFDSIFYTDE